MGASGILTECLHIEKSGRGDASHFVLCNGNKIRYIIDLHGGKSILSRNIKTYSRKLHVLMKLMDILPMTTFRIGKLGYFAKVRPCEVVQRNIKKTKNEHWNVIVGTYDEKQKIVFQCFSDQRKTKYVKVGNKNTEEEMQNEIAYLKTDHSDCGFIVPKLVGYEFRGDFCPFIIQVTEEFSGDKVEPELTEDIVNLYQSICNKDSTFSHGDFAPWNIRKDGEKYILFDWEHCGFRTEGYDLAYFTVVSKMALEHKTVEQALDEGIVEIRRYLPDFSIDKEDFMNEFCHTVKELIKK